MCVVGAFAKNGSKNSAVVKDDLTPQQSDLRSKHKLLLCKNAKCFI